MIENAKEFASEGNPSRWGRIPPIPEAAKSRQRLGQDLQPVGDYAGVEPFYRVSEDSAQIQYQDQKDPEAFNSGDWWWDQCQIRFLNGKAFIGLSALLLLIPYAWGGVVLVGGAWWFYSLAYQLVVNASDIVFMLVMLLAVAIWLPLSILILIKTTPWVVGAFAFLLRPFDKFLGQLMERGLTAGESFFSRETGQVSFAMPGGKKLTAPFEEFDAYVERVIEAGGIYYRLMFVHRYTGKQFSQTSLSRVEPTKEEVMALWDMLQRYMDTSQPLPDVPRLEPFRHLDPATAEHDKRIGRNPRFWRDLDLEAWKQGGGVEWLKRQMEYPWGKRKCKLTPQLGKISMDEYRKQRPAGAWPI
ncbi:MAG: hypothetical protein GYB26_07000 [Gammaproteobacteria bacterium]|uniref:Uncharacterized protein n=1 Tax=Marinobacter litoralis TaxID=187981 RepID=A0A3M2RG15_9GAMM|nr:hypothetical protein [Marinobacter litoralis]MBR9870868.1 hypothetical protein [Gammaproteobacteria bacterium]RMJ03895.1 hypothetical protein DOQ08_01215 [Marinobacter litoralis]